MAGGWSGGPVGHIEANRSFGTGFEGDDVGSKYAGAASTGFGQGRHGIVVDLRRIFLELGSEESRRFRMTELLRQSSEHDAAACISEIIDRLVNFPSTHGLEISALRELLEFHPSVMVKHFMAVNIYDLFNPNLDDRPALKFVHAFLCKKEAHGLSVEQEGAKLQRLLIRRSKQQDLRRVPASPARLWLCQIWLDAPSSRPEDRQFLTGCCARWIADPSASIAEKHPCLALMRQEFEARGHPEGDTWLVSMLLEQVCRDPMGHSPDLQHLLWPLKGVPSPAVLKPLLSGLSEERGRLATLWVCLCLWTPQVQPLEGITQPLPPGCPPPIHALLCTILVTFSQLAGANDLCRTSLLTLAAIATSGEGFIAAAAIELLLLLHREGPVLPADVWLPVMPLLEGSLSGHSAAVELLQRLRRARGSGETIQSLMGDGATRNGPGPSSGCLNGRVLGGLSRNNFPQPQSHQSQPCSADVIPNASKPWGSLASCDHFATAPPMGTFSFGCPPAAPLPGTFPAPRSLAANAVLPTMDSNSNIVANLQQNSGVEVKLAPRHVGLQNTNNTCYMNSFIQSLFLTNYFVWRLFSFQLQLKKNPSKVDTDDFEFGVKLIGLLQRQIAKMMLTRHKHTDIWDMLQAFPENYRSGEQQDVTETVRFVFDKLGGTEQPLIREVFAGELSEKVQCGMCGTIKSRPETFSDLVLSVPPEDVVLKLNLSVTTQSLLEERLKFEYLDDDNLVFCETCQQKQRAGKWCEITSPPRHLCICLNRYNYNAQRDEIAKEKTPVRVEGILQINRFTYELYMVIVHTGKTASSGHYYAVGRRSEVVGGTNGDTNEWVTMDDSQIKLADMSLLNGGQSDTAKDDNPYVLFYRCQQLPKTPSARLPKQLVDEIEREDSKRTE